MERAPDPPGHAEDPDGLGLAALRDYLGFVLRAPRRHKALALGSFLAIVALAVAVARVIPHRYQVEASILAQRSPIMATLSNPGMNREWDAPARAAREVVIRRAHLVALAKDTRLMERYLANRAPAVRARDWLVERLTGQARDPARLFDDLVAALAERLWVTVSAEGAVTITFVWSDRELACEIVAAAMQTFLDERYASEIKAVGEAIAILQSHDAKVEREVAATLERVEERERALGIRSLRPVSGVQRARGPGPEEEVARLDALLAARRRALSDLEGLRQQRLADLQAQLAREQAIYAASHPTLISTRQAVESLSQPSPQIMALRAEAQELERQLALHGRPVTASGPILESDPTGVRLRLLGTDDPRLEFERRRLEDLLRQHSNLLDRIDSAQVEMDTAQAAFKYRYSTIAPPLLPRRPIRPYGLLAVVGGVLGGLSMAFFASTAVDLGGGRILERWQLERSLGLPVLGDVPR
jgi:uncharacterized protein involved in exopolysaccharide biosynthesis